MRKTLNIIVISFLFTACNTLQEEKNERAETTSESKIETKDTESNEDKNFQIFLDSISIYKIKAIDTILIQYNINQIENYSLGKNIII